MSNDTFPDPKVGDPVAIQGRGWREPSRRVITKVTATQVVVDNGAYRFTRSRGASVGTGYDRMWAKPWTEKTDATVAAGRAEEARRAAQESACAGVHDALDRLVRGAGRYSRRLTLEQCALLDRLRGSIDGEWTGAMFALDALDGGTTP